MPTNLLEARGVTKQFGGLTAVNSVDFAIGQGTITSLIGPNGAGKTTFFNMITGLYPPTAGTIMFAGLSLAGLKPNEVTSAGIGRTFQNIRLFANMTALENVLVGQHARLRAGLFGVLMRTPRVRAEESKARRTGLDLLDYVGLGADRANEISKNLPYGDQRRLEVARALATDPQLLLLDERNITVLLIEHDMKVVMGISEYITVLDHGAKIAEGTPAQVRSNERVIEAYLGRGAAAHGKSGRASARTLSEAQG